MFVVTLKFADKSKAPPLMAAHNAWIQRGFDDGVFLVTGSLQPNAGGAVIAHECTRAELDERLAEDPFVAEGVVTAEVLEIAPGRWDERLTFIGA